MSFWKVTSVEHKLLNSVGEALCDRQEYLIRGSNISSGIKNKKSMQLAGLYCSSRCVSSSGGRVGSDETGGMGVWSPEI